MAAGLDEIRAWLPIIRASSRLFVFRALPTPVRPVSGRRPCHYQGPLPLALQAGRRPEYCRFCRKDGLPCAGGEPGADGRLCPYREHTLISRQEHEAWDVLLACQGQLRLAPSGHVVGIDMDAALKIGAARGCYSEVLSELLPAAQAGFVEALCADTDRPH